MPELRISSLYDVRKQPAYLVRLQVAGLIAQLCALTVLWCHMAFGLWSSTPWGDVAFLLGQAVFITAQIFVLRWNRGLKKSA
jgi:uncharacterized membrane protein (DUF2068 family)